MTPTVEKSISLTVSIFLGFSAYSSSLIPACCHKRGNDQEGWYGKEKAQYGSRKK